MTCAAVALFGHVPGGQYLSLGFLTGAALLLTALLSRRDAVSVLGVILVLLLLVPQQFSLAFFTDALSPAVAAGMLTLGLWACLKMVPGLGMAAGPQPVRAAMLFLLWVTAASWVTLQLRPSTSVEGRAALVGMMIMSGAAGIGLLAADGIHSRDRLETLLRWLVLGMTAVAAVGLIQFAFGFDPYQYISIPGLQVGIDGATYIGERSSFRRVGGTAAHPIEFAVILTVVLPLALHFARMPRVGRSLPRWCWWACVVVIIAAIPASVSRSGLLGLAVAGLLLLPAWTWRERLLALSGLTAIAVGVRIAVPGLLGTLVSLFAYAGTDSSIGNRTHELDDAFLAPYVKASPLFGRGFHTFIPNTYDFLVSGYPFVDNQYLLSILETGIVGLVALLAVLLSGLAAALSAHRASVDRRQRDLAYSLFVALGVAAVGLGTFNALDFQIVRGLTFLLIGCAAALLRLQRAAPVAAVAGPAHGVSKSPEKFVSLRMKQSGPRAAASEELSPENSPQALKLESVRAVNLTVVTVTYNSVGDLPGFLIALTSAVSASRPAWGSWRLVVADNASSDGSAELVSELAPWATVIEMGRNAGYAAGINAAVAAAPATDAVLVLNPDVRLDARAVEALLAGLDEPSTGITVPRLLDSSGRLLPSLRRNPSLSRAFGEAVLGKRAGRIDALGEVVLDQRRYQVPGPVDWATGAAMLISTRCFEDVGLWDESFFLYSEETDFAQRARRLGYRVRYMPGAVAWHAHSESATNPQLWAILIVNRVRLYARQHGAVSAAAFWTVTAAGEGGRALFGRSRNRAAFKALLIPSSRPPELS